MIHSIAQTFTRLCAEGRYHDAKQAWSDDIVSIEAFPGPHQVLTGRAAVEAKQRAWAESTTVHSIQTEGPFIQGDTFAVLFQLDATMNGHRSTMREVALYTVKDGKIVQERFLPLMSGDAPPAA